MEIDKETDQHELPEYTQDVAEVESLAANQSALVEYIPKSKATRLNTLIPRNMAFEIQKALNTVIKTRGNIDNYVRDQLRYVSVDQMWKGLAAEQVDAIGLYLAQFDKEQGIIIGDQTGIGKGRQAAAVIRHAEINGYLPIFFTRTPELFTDIYRDLRNIDFAGIRPFIVNTDADAKVKDKDGNVVFTPLSSDHQYDLIVTEKTVPTDSPQSIEWHKRIGKPLPDPEKVPTVIITEVIDNLPADYNMILCTYSQVQAAHPYKRQWIEKVVASGIEGSKRFKRAVFILDESHTAGGYDSIIGKWMRSVLPKAKTCCYLSATFAKYPEVMPLYAAKTAIREAGLSHTRFVDAMERGGLALQEIVASNLAESGQLIRRQRSNEGVRVEYITLDEEPARSKNRDRANRIVRLMNEVVRFEETYIDPILSELHAQAREEGEHLEEKPKSLGVKQSPYFSRVFGIVDQMLFALKVEDVATETIRLLNEDKKVVIAFKSTMGSFLKDLNLQSGDRISERELDFANTMVKGLNSIFYYNYTDIEGKKSRRKIELEQLLPAGIAKYNEIREAMKEESTGLTISPIDKLIHIIEHTVKNASLGGHGGTYFKVAEVTGRNQRVSFDKEEAVVESFRTDAEKFFRLFNNGDFDVLLINQSGSTGTSAHASPEFKDQRIRAMIIHQFELDINIEIQKRGRINRTAQVELPEYYYIVSDIPAERRLMTMLKAKLKSLDANTTGSQKTNDDTLQSEDFLNKYGDNVAWRFIEENPELTERMAWPTYHKVTDKNGNSYYERNESKDGAIRQVTGRAGLLTVEEQDALYNDLLNRYEAEIKWQKQRGTYDLETEFLKLDADIKKKFLFRKNAGGKSPFGKDTIREETIVNNLKRPFTKDEVDNLLASELSGKKPRQVQTALVEEINANLPKIIEERKERRTQTIRKLQEELAILPERGSAVTTEENERIDRQHVRLEDMVQEKTEALAKYVQEMESNRDQILKYVKYFDVGQVVKVPFGLEMHWGIFLGVAITVGKNPYTPGNVVLKFLVTDSRRLVECNLTGEQVSLISQIYTESKEVNDQDVLKVNKEWNELIKSASRKREKRHILTENIVGVSDMIGLYNKLIKYNTLQGEIKNGIVLHRDFGKEGEDRYALAPLSGALPLLQATQVEETFTDHQMRIRFVRKSKSYFQVFIAKKGGMEIYTDETLRTLLQRSEGQSEDQLPDFEQNAGEMTGIVHSDKLEKFILRLDTFGLQYLSEAKELEDWEKDEEEEKKADQQKQYRYKLGRPYGQGSNPTISFTGYEEPSPGFPFGIVVYTRSLTDKEKYNYSLIPVFANVEEPYRTWKAFLEKTALKEEFAREVEHAQHINLYQGVLNLGHFIVNNPHEDGNPEFVFGEYSPEALGRMAYEDMIGNITEIDTVIAQVSVELNPI